MHGTYAVCRHITGTQINTWKNDLDTPHTHDAALMVCCKDAGEGLCSELGTIRSRIKPQATFSFAGDSNKSNVSLTFFELAWHTAFAVNQQEHVLR